MITERVPILKNKDVLIIPVYGELDDVETSQFESNLLAKLKNGKIRGVVLDISSVGTIDLFTARKLMHMVKMFAVLDVDSVLVGMRPAVAITLTDMDIKFPDVATALTLEKGLKRLSRTKK